MLLAGCILLRSLRSTYLTVIALLRHAGCRWVHCSTVADGVAGPGSGVGPWLADGVGPGRPLLSRMCWSTHALMSSLKCWLTAPPITSSFSQSCALSISVRASLSSTLLNFLDVSTGAALQHSRRTGRPSCQARQTSVLPATHSTKALPNAVMLPPTHTVNAPTHYGSLGLPCILSNLSNTRQTCCQHVYTYGWRPPIHIVATV